MSSRINTTPEPGGADRLVVATKLHIPAARENRIARPSLLTRLRDSSARLVVISAPAGAGKTTLLTSWHADPGQPRAFAWLSLDQRDNDPVCFWSGTVAALRSAAPELGRDVDAAIRAPGVDMVELAIPLLVNALTTHVDPLLLVLDDYHEITNVDIHRSLEFLVDHLPASTQVAVATRGGPPFSTARLKARAELLELRATDLRLSEDEAAALLNDSMHLALAPEQVRDLRDRTEGWAAGLQLAGLSLATHPEPQRFIDEFTGDDREVADYLLAEVLDRQDPVTRRFLLQTSILERLCGTLCDAVLQTGGSAERLAAAERANLFLIPLDNSRVWYRFHPLFRDLLEAELRAAAPDEVPALHRRAARWHAEVGFAENGFPAAAIHHAAAAGDGEQTAELIAAHWLTFVNRGELQTVRGWIASLPDDERDDPRILLAWAWTLLLLGRPGEVDAVVASAERSVVDRPMRDGSRSVRSNAAAVRTSAHLLLGDVGKARRAAELAEELESGRASPWRPLITNARGMVAYWTGATLDAEVAFQESIDVAHLPANRAYALGYLAVIAGEGGDHEEARRLARDAIRLAEEHRLAEHWVTIMAHYAAGSAACSRGEPTAGVATIEHGLGIARRGGLRLDVAHGLLALTHIALRAGDRVRARELLDRVERQLAVCPDPGMLVDRFEQTRGGVSPGRATRVRTPSDELSDRELGVLRLLTSSLSLREIADELYISSNTVKTHVRHVYAKLQVSDRAEAVARARELRLM